jgi:hypothetical protein
MISRSSSAISSIACAVMSYCRSLIFSLTRSIGDRGIRSVYPTTSQVQQYLARSAGGGGRTSEFTGLRGFSRGSGGMRGCHESMVAEGQNYPSPPQRRFLNLGRREFRPSSADSRICAVA